MRPRSDTRGEEHLETTPSVRDAEPGLRRAQIFWEGGFASFALPRAGRLVLGRSADCDVQIDHTSVSRRHAVLHLGVPLRVEDLGSSNGTHVGGARLAPGAPTPIAAGDLVEIGSTMLLLQHGDEPDTAGAAPTTGATLHPPPPAASPTSAREGLVVRDAAMERVHRLLELVAQGTISVLLLGETGVGKEVAAATIHRCSPRKARPMLALNCAALPEALLESELFGHERGAFTGALSAKPGLLEAAAGGTVFLDEVGELPLATQAKLLRVVESREATRIGGLSPRPIDVRFVSATNRDLDEQVRAQRFRQDLFFRLGGVTVTIPPLRERALEIPALAQLFAERACADLGRPAVEISREAMDRLERHAWPGNLRELRNVIERAVLICTTGRLSVEHLPLERMGAAGGSAETPGVPPQAPSEAGLRGELQAFERQRILDALDRCGGNQTQAARMLGISRRTLLERLDAHALPRPRKGRSPAS